MQSIIHPITDETTADRAIELFLDGYDPLLYAADLGLTPEQVFEQIRTTMRIYVEKALAPAEMGRRGGSATSKAKAEAARANGAKGGRPRKP